MKHYFSLYYHFIRNCLMRELEFRFNFFIWTIMGFVWLGLAVASVSLIFGQVTTIAGWTKDQTLLLVYTTAIFNDFLWTFVFQNINSFSHMVRHGEMDFVLLKPISPRFMLSTRYVEFDHFIRVAFLIYMITHQLSILDIHPAAINWLFYWLIFFEGFFAVYNIFFFITTTNIWFIRLFNLDEILDNTIQVSRYPLDIYKGKFKLFLTYVIPIAFVATFPVLALLGQLPFYWLLIGLVIDVATFLISQRFWHFAIRHYSSASS